jgi:integration host factor subunit beta
MADTPAEGDRLEIRGFCSFYVKKYKAYAERNPKTGEPIKLKAKKLPFFKCGRDLKGATRWFQRVDPINREKFIKSRSL